MTEEMRVRVRELLEQFRLPLYNEIPDVGLYLEQTAKFVSEYLAPLPGVTLTTSMISNYVKKDLIANPVKKQYYRDQIVDILFIAIAKSVLSLDDIRFILQLQKETWDAPTAYAWYCKDLLAVLGYVLGAETTLEPIPEDGADAELLIRSAWMTVSHHIYLERCFKVLSEMPKAPETSEETAEGAEKQETAHKD